MKKMAGGLLALGLVFGAAACGVDKAGTADNVIKSVEKQYGTLTDTQKSCITDLVKSYSDSDLKTLDSIKTDTTDAAQVQLATDFGTKLGGCVAGGDTGTADTSGATDAPADTTEATG